MTNVVKKLNACEIDRYRYVIKLLIFLCKVNSDLFSFSQIPSKYKKENKGKNIEF